jgi:hypothetical protein
MNGAGRASGQAGIALTTEPTKGGIGAPAYHARSSGRVIEYPASAFDIENVHLKFTRGALHAIRTRGAQAQSGARGGAVLRTVPTFNGEPAAIPQVQNLFAFVRISGVIIRHYLGFGYLENKSPSSQYPFRTLSDHLEQFAEVNVQLGQHPRGLRAIMESIMVF